MAWLGVVSFGIAALVYAATAALLIAGRPASGRALLLAVAAMVTSAWGASIAVLSVNGDAPFFAILGFDALHMFAWTACTLSWLSSASAKGAKRLLIGASLVLLLYVPVAAAPSSPLAADARTIFPALVVMALLGFLAVEQVFRNSKDEQRKPLAMLSLAAGGVFAIDLFVYTLSTLLNGLVPIFWEMRGVANAALAPLIVVAIKRQADWESELFVSRQVVFYTASLLGVGTYVLAMGIVAYLLHAFGGSWTWFVELLFLLAAVGLLLFVLFSARIRARFRVLVIKHFYRNRYDYREEWLRLTQSLAGSGDARLLAEKGLAALARIIGAPRGALWLAREGATGYEYVASTGGALPAAEDYEMDHPLVTFLVGNGWVIDSDEYARRPDSYGTWFGHPDEGVLPKDSIIVPLSCQADVLGFVVLERPSGLRALNFEDHDILKSAGRQVAVVLAQARMQETLAETRQFEVMNRLSTFLMHDLKNIVAQQELVIANAQRFRHRPEFIDDAITTIRGGVERMKKVLEQLNSSSHDAINVGRADVTKIMMEVRSQCADRVPIPELELGEGAALVALGRDKLASALTHLVRNAQDATPPDGSIRLRVVNNGHEILIVVADTGCGMDDAFVRDRLFRPFDSTKGAKGMGIGAYQVRHLIRAAGGEVEVESNPGAGTSFCLRLPAAAGGAANGGARAGDGRAWNAGSR